MPVYRGYQTDPALARAASNIAGLFAPPSGADAAGWANANATREKAARLAELYASAADPSVPRDVFDRRGIAVGNYVPTQSFYAQDQNNQTAIRGQDVTARTARENNLRDNARQMATTRYGALSEGQMLPEMPGSVASMYGLPESPVVQGNMRLRQGEAVMRPDGTQVAGPQAPLTMDQVRGAAFSSLPLEQQQMATLAGPGLQQTRGHDGQPVYTPNAQAVGQPAFVAPSGARPVNGQATINGRMVPVVQDPATNRWRIAQTGEEVPPDVQVTQMAQPTGSNEQIGASTRSRIDQQLIDANVARDTAVQLRDLIARAPASQGVLGSLRGTAQNFLQTGGELGQFFGGRVAEVQRSIASGAADASLGGAFDPNIPAIEMLSNLLAFQYAKLTTGERLSNEMLRASRTALGLDGLSANQASSITRLNEAIKSIDRQEAILRGSRGSGGPAQQTLPPPNAPSASTPGMMPLGAAPSASGAPAAPAPPPRRLRFNPATGQLE